MYENRARLLCTAETPPVELLERIVTVADALKVSPRSSRAPKGDDPDLCVDNELGFAKDRTISRSVTYIEQNNTYDVWDHCRVKKFISFDSLEIILSTIRSCLKRSLSITSSFSLFLGCYCRLTEMNSKEYLEQHEANLHRSSGEAHDNGDMLQSRQLVLD